MAKSGPSRFDDLFQAFPGLAARRMFGGAGLFVDGLMIGIVMDDRIYLKTDEKTRKAFIAEKAKPFTYGAKGGRRVSLNYYTMPERLYDDPDDFADWARQALAVAQAAPDKKKTAKKKKSIRR